MSVQKWRRRRTKYFGEIWVPYAHVELRDADDRFHALAIQVDSGAVISLLRRSVAEILQIQLESGRQIELGGVGGAKTTAYIHTLFTRFDETMAFDVPFAIASNEEVPNLLGRLGVFDVLQIDFDGTLTETRVTAPWLNDEQRKNWEFILSTTKDVLRRWEDVQLPAPAKEAAKQMFTRANQLVASAAGMMKLHREYDGLLIIRALFETAAQFEYLLKDKEERESRGKAFLDFAHITRHRRSQRIANNPLGPISEQISQSPLRAEAEARNKKEFDRVKGAFLRPKGKVWDRWYCMSMFDLAKATGLEGEYQLWYARGSGWTHGDPCDIQEMIPFGNSSKTVVFLMCLHFYARIILRLSEGLVLTHEQYEGLKILGQNLA